jgi:hypothetical protein
MRNRLILASLSSGTVVWMTKVSETHSTKQSRTSYIFDEFPFGWSAATPRNLSRLPAAAEGTSILARNGRGRCGKRPHARNGQSQATRMAAAASEAGRFEQPV